MELGSVRVLVLDDELDALQESIEAIGKFVPKENIKGASTEIEALGLISSENIDLLFLDVEMPGSNGFVLADYIHKVRPGLEYVFLTGHAELGEESYNHEPLGFLSKPIDMARLHKTLERYLAGVKDRKSKEVIAVDTGSSGFLLLSASDILYIAKEGRQTVIHCEKEKHTVRYSLDVLETIFEDYGMFRIHQSILAPLGRIAQVQMSELGKTFVAILDTGEKLPVSRGKYAKLREHLLKKGVRFI